MSAPYVVVIVIPHSPFSIQVRTIAGVMGPFPTHEEAEAYARDRNAAQPTGDMVGEVQRLYAPSNTTTVHMLRHGVVACIAKHPQLRGVPGEWPPGQIWASFWNDVTCADCLAHMGDKR